MQRLTTYAMTAEEAEAIAEEYNPRAIVVYEGGLVTVKLPQENNMVCDNVIDFVSIFRKHHQSDLGDHAIAIYEQNYQCFAKECAVIVIDKANDFKMDEV